jgi:hypothetical protein
MQRTIVGLTVLLLAARTLPAYATDATCTVTRAVSTNSLNLTFVIPSAVGLVLPVTFDEAAGTFSMSRDPWNARYGSNGAVFTTVGSVLGFLILEPGTVTGTIDAGGNITLPNFGMAFATDFCPPRSPDYPLLPELRTGTQFLRVTGQSFAVTGVPLDFATGTLTLDGQDVIPGACGAPGALLSGLRLTCTLSPVPNQALLAPAATALTASSGKAVIGKPLPEEPPAKPVKGDVLTLKTKLGQWASLADVGANDVFLSLAGGESRVVVRVPAGRFQTRGKKAVVKDSDGTSIEVSSGHKESATVSAAYGGVMTFVSGRKGLALKLRLLGLDLTGLTGPTVLAVAVGERSATVDLTATGTGKTRKIR